MDNGDSIYPTGRFESPKYSLALFCSYAVGGPDRPISKSQAAQQYSQDRQRVLAERAIKRSNTASSQESASSTQGIFAQMQQSLSERGVRLDGIQEQFNQLGEASQGWYESLGKAVENQKRKYALQPGNILIDRALLGSVTGKLNPF